MFQNGARGHFLKFEKTNYFCRARYQKNQDEIEIPNINVRMLKWHLYDVSLFHPRAHVHNLSQSVWSDFKSSWSQFSYKSNPMLDDFLGNFGKHDLLGKLNVLWLRFVQRM